MVIVQILKVGRPTRSFDVSSNPTLGNALDLAGEEFGPGTITVNQTNDVNVQTYLFDGDRIFIGSLVKGNAPFVVQFMRLGQSEVITVTVETPVTIGECIAMMTPENRAHFIDANGKYVFQYQINGVKLDSDGHVDCPESDGQAVRVVCAVKVKGNL